MRRLLTGLVVAATTTLAPVFAWAGNQEFAEQIAKTLRTSGQMHDYKIGVKYQDGTAWLKGSVCNDEQMKTANSIVSQIPGVTRVVSNLSVNADQAVEQAPALPAPQPVMQTVSMPVQQASAEEAVNSPRMVTYPTATPVPSSFRQAAARPTSATEEQPAAQVAMRHVGAPRPMAYAPCATQAGYGPVAGGTAGAPRYDQPNMPCHAWPSYAAYPNYAAVTYPRQYSPSAWPFIGPFYPYPQVPLGWRKVTLEWDDGWWMLDFKQ